LNGRTIYTREQQFGGRQLVEDVQRRFGLSAAEAENAIRRHSLPIEYESEVLMPFKEAAAQQANRSLQFFFSSSHYNDVDCIVLAGGVAAVEGLGDMVQESLGIPVIIGDLFLNIATSSKVNRTMLANDAPSLMIACGLAMRSKY
jgi:type IV pilus assembly protein PilM